MAQKKNQKREPKNRKQEQLDREIQQTIRANEKHFARLKKSNDKLDKSLRNWIASNAKLWADLSARQQAEILAGGMAAAEVWDDVSQRAKDYQNIQSDLLQDMQSQYKKNHHVLEGMDVARKANLDRYEDLVKQNTRTSRKGLSVMDNIVDRTNQIKANALMIGTTEFQSLDLTRDIAKAKADGTKEDIKQLDALQKEQEIYARIHKQIDETGKLLEQPFTWIDSMIKEIPIIGNLLSAIIPFESWGKELSDSFREGASEKAADLVTGKTRKERKEDREAAEKTKKETLGKAEVGGTEEWQKEQQVATEDNTEELTQNTEAIKSNANDTTDTTEGGKSISDLWNLFSSPRTAYVHVTNFGDIEAGDNTERQYEDGTILDATGNPVPPTDISKTVKGAPQDAAKECELAAQKEQKRVDEEENKKEENNQKDIADECEREAKENAAENGGDDPPDNTKPEDETKQLSLKEKLTQKMKKAMQKVGEIWKKIPMAGKMLLGTLGLAAAVFYKMWSTARDLGVAMNEMPYAAMLFKDEAEAILESFGSLRDVSSKTLFTMKKMAVMHGVQAKDMATILALQTATTSQSKDMGLKTQAKWIKEIKKEGLSANKVLADMAANADFMAEHMRNGGENIKNAAKHMAKMGLNLQVAESAANTLLDWETSIAAEMQASVILGRSLNFERARSLMYNDKIEEAMKEIKNQVGGEAEFAKMSSTQRKVLGETIGIQGEALAKFMQTEEQQRAESAKSEKEAAVSRAKKWALFGAVALAVITALAAAYFSMMSLGVAGAAGIATTLGWAAAGAAAGAIAGGAIFGGLGYATAATGMDEMVAEPTMILAGEAGPEHVGITPMRGGGPPESAEPTVVNVDTSKMEEQNEKIIQLLVSRKDDAMEQARKQKGATLDAGKQR
jgi:hypothetical protein